MALSNLPNFELVGSTIVIPKNQEDNSFLEGLTPLEKEQLILHTGIKFRRVAPESDKIENYFQLGISQLLDQLNWEPSQIDVLICVTQSLQTPIPSFSCQIHGLMNFPLGTLCYDINSGCSGFVYGVHTVMSIMNSLSKANAKAILCCGDFSSQLIDRNDKSTLPIFSDAVSISGIEKKNTGMISHFNLETDGSGRNAIFLQDKTMKLNGIDVFNYSLKLVPNHLRELFKLAEIEFPEKEVVVFHQANKLINDSLIKRLNLDSNKVPSTLYQFGNTASASIPLSLGIYASKNPVTRAVLCGFGVGFSLASALVYLSSDYKFCIIEK